MGLLKRFEVWGKYALALVSIALFWRPGRRSQVLSRIAAAQKLLLVRIDDRVGEALLMTPLLTALKRQRPDRVVDVLLHQRAVRVLESHPDVDHVLGLDRSGLALGPFAPGLRALRARHYDVVVDCANWEVPSVTSAMVSRLAGPHGIVVGPAVWPTARLHDLTVRARPNTVSELSQRVHLLAPLGADVPNTSTSFRRPRLGATFEATLARLTATPSTLVNPGGRLDWRRVPPFAFAEAARELVRRGRTPIVTWGPGEESLAQAVCRDVPEALLAPPTDLDELAALMSAAGQVICNNTGPMHLAAAVKARTLAFFCRVSLARWGYPTPHRMADLTDDVSDESRLRRRVIEEVAAFLSA